MSRQYLNDRWCVRCGRKDPTPYLKNNVKLFMEKEFWRKQVVVDIGCGNGRNSKYMMDLGFAAVCPFDMKNDFGTKITLGKDQIPIENEHADIILANYVLMFLSKKELHQVLDEIKRIISPDGMFMFELYPAKDCEYPTKESIKELSDFILEYTGFKKIKHTWEHGILKAK